MFPLDHRIMQVGSDLQRTSSRAPSSELVQLDQVLQGVVQSSSEYFDQMFFKYFCIKPKLLQFVLWFMSNRCFTFYSFHSHFQVFTFLHFSFLSLLTLSVLIHIIFSPLFVSQVFHPVLSPRLCSSFLSSLLIFK